MKRRKWRGFTNERWIRLGWFVLVNFMIISSIWGGGVFDSSICYTWFHGQTWIGFILESINKYWFGLYLSSLNIIQAYTWTHKQTYIWVYRLSLVGFMFESIGKHWLGLHLRSYVNIIEAYTWVRSPTLVRYMLGSINKHWSGLYLSSLNIIQVYSWVL